MGSKPGFCTPLKLYTPGTVAYTVDCFLYHLQPPEPFLDQAEGVVSTLVSSVLVVAVDHGAVFMSGYYEC